MKVLMCVDPAFAATGVVLLEHGPRGWQLVTSTVIETAKADKKRGLRVADDTVDRASLIYRELSALVEAHHVAGFACELPSGGGKSSTAVKAMALATAIVACLVERHRLPAEWVSPSDVKQALCACRNASKEDMMAEALRLWPSLAVKWCRKGKPLGRFEHVADAAGVFAAVKDGRLARMLELPATETVLFNM